MDPESAKYFAQAIMVVSMMANAIGEALVVSSAFKAMGRNPMLVDKLWSKVIIAVALVESTAIYALVAFFLTVFL